MEVFFTLPSKLWFFEIQNWVYFLGVLVFPRSWIIALKKNTVFCSGWQESSVANFVHMPNVFFPDGLFTAESFSFGRVFFLVGYSPYFLLYNCASSLHQVLGVRNIWVKTILFQTNPQDGARTFVGARIHTFDVWFLVCSCETHAHACAAKSQIRQVSKCQCGNCFYVEKPMQTCVLTLITSWTLATWKPSKSYLCLIKWILGTRIAGFISSESFCILVLRTPVYSKRKPSAE